MGHLGGGLRRPAGAHGLHGRVAHLVTPQGTRGFTLWLGPLGSRLDDMPLRLDLDPGAAPIESMDAIADLPEITADNVRGGAAARWLPDEHFAIEADCPGVDLQVMESSHRDLLTVPATLARISVRTALRLAADYCTTNERPTGVEWWAAPTG